MRFESSNILNLQVQRFLRESSKTALKRTSCKAGWKNTYCTREMNALLKADYRFITTEAEGAIGKKEKKSERKKVNREKRKEIGKKEGLLDIYTPNML